MLHAGALRIAAPLAVGCRAFRVRDETLYELGLGQHVVGRSDYCDYPADVAAKPALGTAITPQLEGLVRLRPTHILTEVNQAYQLDGFRDDMQILALPWLTASNIIAGIEVMGRTFDVVPAAASLSARLATGLTATVSHHSPEVLFVLGTELSHDGTVWYLRPDSLHGQAIAAAGAANAMPASGGGSPTLSLEQLFRLDPQYIVFVGSPEGELPIERFDHLAAVRDAKVGRVDGTGLLRAGPGVLKFVDEVRSELVRLGALTEASHAEG